MSKTVKAIVIAIICEVLYGLYASFSSLWSVVFFILAALGGEIVFLGLWIEEEAGKADKKEHLSSFSDEVRRIKLKSKIGWWILMGGIGFEVLAATGLAIRDDWEIRNVNANAKKNNPLNQPISDMTGVVTVLIRKRFLIPPRKGDGKPPDSGQLFLHAFNSNAVVVLPNIKM